VTHLTGFFMTLSTTTATCSYTDADNRRCVFILHRRGQMIVTVDIWQNEDTAAIVCIGIAGIRGCFVESVMKKPVKCVNVLPKNPHKPR